MDREPRRVARTNRLLPGVVLFLILLSTTPTSSTSAAVGVSSPPPEIASDCSRDVTKPLLSWIASVPDNSTLSFRSGACYRIESTLEIHGRSGLVFEGNGAVFQSFDPPAEQRAIWRAVGAKGLIFRNMTVLGSYAKGGTHDESLQHAHAFDLRGTSVVISNVAASRMSGDCVFFGVNYFDNTTRSSGSVRDSVCSSIGRNAVSVVGGDDIRVERMTTDRIGLIVFDVEPNPPSTGVGNGSDRVIFDNNTIGSYFLYAYAVIGNAPVTAQTFSNNRVVGQGLRIGILYPHYRPRGITITGNTSDTATHPVAVEAQGVDGLRVERNTIPMSTGLMAGVQGSCDVAISGNSYPGGSAEYTISNTPSTCTATVVEPVAARPVITSFTPRSGSVRTRVSISGAHFSGATRVTFKRRAAQFVVSSDRMITAVVPRRAKTGPIRVTTPAGTATSSTRFVVRR
jgi:hypothetical protein